MIRRQRIRQSGTPGDSLPARGARSRLFRRSALLSVPLLLLLTVAPGAQDFRRFSALIPDGWEVTERPQELLILRSPDGDAAAVIICAPLPDERPARDMLEGYVRYFSGSEPQQRNENAHTFIFVRNGVRNTALFLHDAHQYLLLTVSDPRQRYPECLDMLMDSLVLRKDDGPATP